jgi:hypothetical protein
MTTLVEDYAEIRAQLRRHRRVCLGAAPTGTIGAGGFLCECAPGAPCAVLALRAQKPAPDPLAAVRAVVEQRFGAPFWRDPR